VRGIQDKSAQGSIVTTRAGRKLSTRDPADIRPLGALRLKNRRGRRTSLSPGYLPRRVDVQIDIIQSLSLMVGGIDIAVIRKCTIRLPRKSEHVMHYHQTSNIMWKLLSSRDRSKSPDVQ